MSFGESVLSSSIGAFGGFLGALIVFFIKERCQCSIRKRSTIENLKLELTYNINLYEKFEKQIQDSFEDISRDKRKVHLTLNYHFVATCFAKQFYEYGLLLKHFHVEDMRRWNVIVTQISDGAEKHVIECVDQWRENKGIKKETVCDALKYEKAQIAYAKEMSEYILKRL